MSSAAQPRVFREPRVLVFNPSHLAKDVAVFGDFYHFEPFSVGTCCCAHHNVPGREDNVGVHAKYDWPRDDKNILLIDKPREVVRPAVGALGEGVADYIVSADSMGPLHFVILEGDAQQQEEQKREAIHRFVEAYMPEVEATIDTWEAQLGAYLRERPNGMVPRQPKHVTAAYAYREKHAESSLRQADKNYVVCRTCGDRLADETDYAEHLRRRHPALADAQAPAEPAPVAKVTQMPQRVAQATPESVIPPVEAPDPTEEAFSDDVPGAGRVGTAPSPETDHEPAAPAGQASATDPDQLTRPASIGRGTPPKSAGQKLIDRAQAGQVALSVADIKGLQHGDRDVLADVFARLKAAKVP